MEQDSIKITDVIDGFFFLRINRLSSVDSYLLREDFMKFLLWYGSSFDFEVVLYIFVLQQFYFEKINELNFELNLEDLYLGTGYYRIMNRILILVYEVRLVREGEGDYVVFLKLVTVEFDYDLGGRFLFELFGRGLLFFFY